MVYLILRSEYEFPLGRTILTFPHEDILDWLQVHWVSRERFDSSVTKEESIEFQPSDYDDYVWDFLKRSFGKYPRGLGEFFDRMIDWDPPRSTEDVAAFSLRLDAAAAQMADPGIQKFITGARSLVSRIQTETRNLVADLRESPAKMADLNAALRELSPATTPGQVGPEVFLSLDEKVTALPTRVVHHLKMIAGEAVTNSIKHAQATRIEIKTLLEDNHLTMMILDDGKGFDADRESKGRSGHFGCMGMRERARKVNATITWKSGIRGTSVIVTLNPGKV